MGRIICASPSYYADMYGMGLTCVEYLILYNIAYRYINTDLLFAFLKENSEWESQNWRNFVSEITKVIHFDKQKSGDEIHLTRLFLEYFNHENVLQSVQFKDEKQKIQVIFPQKVQQSTTRRQRSKSVQFTKKI